MNDDGTSFVLRFLALPVSSGISGAIVTVVFGMEHKLGAIIFVGGLFALAGAIIGVPAVLIADRIASNCRFRYVVAGVICAGVIYLLFISYFLPGIWEAVWLNDTYMDDPPIHNPRIEVVTDFLYFSAIGFLAGVIYTGLNAAINRYSTQDDGA